MSNLVMLVCAVVALSTAFSMGFMACGLLVANGRDEEETPA